MKNMSDNSIDLLLILLNEYICDLEDVEMAYLDIHDNSKLQLIANDIYSFNKVIDIIEEYL
jgi:hypothetical protein